MNTNHIPSKPLSLATEIFGLALAALFTSTALATTNHWSGGACATPVVGGCDWGNDQNWFEQSAPANNGSADIIFLGSVALTPDMNDPWTVHSITFDTTAGAFLCAGEGKTLTIQAGGIANNSLNTQSLGITASRDTIVFGASHTWAANP